MANATPQPLRRRRFDVSRVAQRQKGAIGSPYNMFRLATWHIAILCHRRMR